MHQIDSSLWVSTVRILVIRYIMLTTSPEKSDIFSCACHHFFTLPSFVCAFPRCRARYNTNMPLTVHSNQGASLVHSNKGASLVRWNEGAPLLHWNKRAPLVHWNKARHGGGFHRSRKILGYNVEWFGPQEGSLYHFILKQKIFCFKIFLKCSRKT